MGSTPAEFIWKTVRYNAGGPQSDAIDEHHLRTICIGNRPLTVDDFEVDLKEALAKGWVKRDVDGWLHPIE